MPLATGQVLNNRYRIVKLLGQGGFGAVYRAWDTNLDCPRALKENLDTSPEAQRQFKREAQILTLLTHPNLPKVIDHFVVPGQGQYLVMDYVEGQDLQQMLDAHRGPLPEAQALAWTAQVCEALAHLHALEPPIIHRDIKPANIKITPQGRAVLVDFGIAKIYDPQLSTTRGARAVTPGYSPHEQYGQGHTDARSDVYALGASLYHLLTGQQPVESIQRVIDDPLLPPEQANPSLSPAACAAVRQAMAVDPKQRFQSITEFRAALQTSPAPAPAGAPAPQPTPTTLVIPPAAPQSAADSQPPAAQPASTPKPARQPVGVQGLRPPTPEAQPVRAQSLQPSAQPASASNKRQLAFLALFLLLYGLGYYLADSFWYSEIYSYIRSQGYDSSTYVVARWVKFGIFFLAAFSGGWLCDHRDHRQILLFSALGSSLAMLATLLLPTPGAFSLVQLISSACFAAALPTALAYASNLSSEIQRPGALGILAAVLTLATQGSSRLFVTFVSNLNTSVFAIAAGLCLLALGLVTWKLKPASSRPVASPANPPAQVFHRPLAWLFLLAFLAGSAYGAVNNVLNYRGAQLESSLSVYSTTLLVSALLLASIQIFGAPPLMRRWGEKSILRAALLLSLASALFIFTTSQSNTLYLVIGLATVAYGILTLALWLLASKRDSLESGLTLGGVFGLAYLGSMLASMVTTTLIKTLGTEAFWFCAILFLTALLLTLPAFKRL